MTALTPIHAELDRITSIHACLRPFRAAGPRIETERLGEKTVVHNYGHGGSGWSVSWGSSAMALQMVQATGVRELAVIGCGALGLTSAVLAQRAGLSVRIYAKALPPRVHSMHASGLWTPDSRISDAAHALEFGERWEAMVRNSYATYQGLLDRPGKPVSWIDSYSLSHRPFVAHPAFAADEPAYAEFADRVSDLTFPSVTLDADSHPFAHRHVRRERTMMFNIGTYTNLPMSEFLGAGGKIIVREFDTPGDLLMLPESTLIHATGFGARALFGDRAVIPVRGQTARLIPQPEITYGLRTDTLSVVPRSDGLLVQALGHGGDFGNDNIAPNRAETEAAVRQLAAIVDGMRKVKR